MEEQSAALKKMGSHLTMLEHAKLKKPPHVEAFDEKKREDWDERDKVDYEGNKQFEKLTAETIAMREKIEKMQLSFRKTHGGIISKTPIALPLKFKISNMEKFDGTGDPKQHVWRYLSNAKMKGLDEKQTLHTFPLSLTGGASKWYYSLDPSKTKVWNELVELIVDQFIFNTVIDVTLRDLETAKQGVGETLSKYMTR